MNWNPITYVQLFKLHGDEDGARVFDWLRKTDKYNAANMQNETVIVMAMQVVCAVATTFLQKTAYYTIMVKETTDISNCEQHDDDGR